MNLLLTRAMNYWRGRSLLTYCGLRAFAKSHVSASGTGWIDAVVARKSALPSQTSTITLKHYKGTTECQPIYRDITVLSPTGAIFESWLLERLAREPGFSCHPSVYSYRWPNSARTWSSFANYRDGYLARNAAVSDMLRRSASTGLFVSDIRSFYPCIDHDTLRENLGARMSIAGDIDPVTQSVLQNILRWSLRGDGGLPVGPASSHFLANFALGDLDSRMHSTFASRYFRYVDDILVVIKPHERKGVESLVSQCLTRSKLTMHEDKTAFLSAVDWFGYVPSEDRVLSRLLLRFDQLMDATTLRLASGRDARQKLSDQCHRVDLTLPLRRLGARVMGRTWPWRRLRIGRLLQTLATFRGLSVSHVVDEALRLRDELADKLEWILSSRVPEQSTLRRYYFQKVRACAGRLLYLADESMRAQIVRWLEKHEDTVDMKHLFAAISTGSVDDLIRFPGAIVNAYCAFVGERSGRFPTSKRGEILQPDDELLESLVSLTLYGIVTSDRLDPVSATNTGRFATLLQQPNIRLWEDFGYFDEVQSLMLDVSRTELANFPWTSAAIDEDNQLEGTLLSSEGSIEY